MAFTMELSIRNYDMFLGTHYIKGESGIWLWGLADTGNSSKIVSQTTSIGNLVSEQRGDAFLSPFPTYGEITLKSTATDSTGRVATKSQVITVYDYEPPSLLNPRLYRSNANGTANPDGSYVTATANAKISSVGNYNQAKPLKISKKEPNQTWTLLKQSPASYSSSISHTFALGVDNNIEIKFEVGDSKEDISRVLEEGPGFVLMDFHNNGKGMAIGKTAEGNGVLDIKGDVYANGALNVTGGANYSGRITSSGVTSTSGSCSFSTSSFSGPVTASQGITSTGHTKLQGDVTFSTQPEFLDIAHFRETPFFYRGISVQSAGLGVYGGNIDVPNGNITERGYRVLTSASSINASLLNGYSVSEILSYSGYNGNGHFVRLRDGTLIMWSNATLTYTSNVMLHGTITLPYDLYATNSAIIIMSPTAESKGVILNGVSWGADISSTTTAYLRCFPSTGQSFSSGLTKTFRIIIIGRWKA